MEVTEVGGYEMVHVGGSTITPWDTEREYTEEEYRQRFAELVPKVKDMRRCIFNVHVPPYGTVLDKCPKLDENLQVVFDMGNPVSMHAGSSTLVEVLQEAQPLLGTARTHSRGPGTHRHRGERLREPGQCLPRGNPARSADHAGGGQGKERAVDPGIGSVAAVRRNPRARRGRAGASALPGVCHAVRFVTAVVCRCDLGAEGSAMVSFR